MTGKMSYHFWEGNANVKQEDSHFPETNWFVNLLSLVNVSWQISEFITAFRFSTPYQATVHYDLDFSYYFYRKGYHVGYLFVWQMDILTCKKNCQKYFC